MKFEIIYTFKKSGGKKVSHIVIKSSLFIKTLKLTNSLKRVEVKKFLIL